MTPLELAKIFHETHERLAPEYGYETRDDTKEFDPASKNGRLMVATCEAILNHFSMVDVHPIRPTSGLVLNSDILKAIAINWQEVDR